ncbi:MAG: hypothetical protein M1530_01655 [Candidatus Marsarchaeota archaeon]|nr:hypothetical protein [Candidatus Marsarchaeota archaeon]
MRQANAGAAASSPISSPPSWVHPTTPTTSQPIEWAFIELSPASPSVDDHVSSLHPPVFFWAWGEHHASALTSYYTLNPACGESKISLSEFGKPTLSGTLTWSLPGASVLQPLDNHAPALLQNPLPASAWASLSTTQGPNKSAVLPPFSLSFSGMVQVPYMREVVEHYMLKSKDAAGNTIESCQTSYSSTLVTFSLPVHSARHYGVEHGEPLFIKLRPADREQLSPSSGFWRADLTNRLPFSSLLALDGAHISSTRYARYSMLKDEVGFWSIGRQENAGNFTNLFLEPSELDAQGRAFAYQYSQQMRYPFPLGLSNLTLEWSDDFGDKWSASFQLLTRAPSGIAGAEAKNATAVLEDERAPAASAQSSTYPGLIRVFLPSSDSWRGAQADYFQPSSLAPAAGGLLMVGAGLWLVFYLRQKV